MDETTKVIFLDIDGVLNGHDGIAVLRRECCERLNRIIKATGAKVVLVSAWRYMILDTGEYKSAMTCTGFGYMLKTHGIDCEIVGTTCSDEECMPRGEQVRKWMRDNYRPDRWCVIDDGCPVEFGYAPLLSFRLITPKSSIGLQENHVRRAIELLN